MQRAEFYHAGSGRRSDERAPELELQRDGREGRGQVRAFRRAPRYHETNSLRREISYAARFVTPVSNAFVPFGALIGQIVRFGSLEREGVVLRYVMVYRQ